MNTTLQSKVSQGSALILLAHGARDERWREPFDSICAEIRQQISDGSVTEYGAVEVAFLEHMSPDFLAATQRLYHSGYRQIDVAPLFLGVGGHVRSDVPRLLAQAKEAFADLDFLLKPPLGQSAQVLSALVSYCVTKE